MPKSEIRPVPTPAEALEVAGPSPAADTDPAPAPARKRRKLTLPLFSLAHKSTMAILVTGPFRRASMPGLAKNEDGMVTILPCIDIDTGEEGLLLAYTMVESAITRSCDDYVGKRYELVRGEKAPGKSYYDVEVYELFE